MKKKKKQQFIDLADRYRGDGVGPPCKHFGKCGGCMFQDLAYENQLLLKKEYINTVMDGITSVEDVFPSVPLAYRNRMDMVTAFGKFGLREAGNFRFVADVESCEIMQERTNEVFKTIRPLVRAIDGYNYLSHKGYLRYVVFRQAYFTGQTMVNFVIAERENRLDPVIKALEGEVDSISLILSDGLADVSFGEVVDDIKQGHIEEHFGDVRYRITPNSFFQSNSYIAEKMYSRIKEEIDGQVIELYSGVGSISLYVADKAEHITAVELNDESVRNAEINKELNNIENVTFLCRDARDFVRENTTAFDTMLLDPPRSGMNPKMHKHVAAINPQKIVYMSCNPATFKDDLLAFTDYELQSFEAYDMFPQTPHMETLAVLTKRSRPII